MGVLTNLYRYVVREGWLRLTGRPEQAEEEADAWARADADDAVGLGRSRLPYRRYLGEVEAWKEGFRETLSKIQDGGPHRKMAVDSEALSELQDVPEPTLGTFGFPHERLADHAAMVQLRDETRVWREDRLARVRERLGLP